MEVGYGVDVRLDYGVAVGDWIIELMKLGYFGFVEQSWC